MMTMITKTTIYISGWPTCCSDGGVDSGVGAGVYLYCSLNQVNAAVFDGREPDGVGFFLYKEGRTRIFRVTRAKKNNRKKHNPEMRDINPRVGDNARKTIYIFNANDCHYLWLEPKQQ